MTNIDIPLGKRTLQYRFFEILPGALSYAVVLSIFISSLFEPFVAAILILVVVSIMFVKSVAMAASAIRGARSLEKSRKVNWAKLLKDLENPSEMLFKRASWLHSKQFGMRQHVINLYNISQSEVKYPKPSEIINLDMIAFYNEPYEVLEPTLISLAKSNYDVKKQLIVVIAYEQRGGAKAQATVKQIKKHWKGVFRELLFVEHPKDIPGEVVGKGPNLTYAGKYMAKWVKENGLDPENIIVTSQDCDNHPDPDYFAYLTYEWIVTPERQNMSFQPICVFTNNIWDVPAPMRVIATGNSFWNIISSMRPHSIRNFASHAQGMRGLIDMEFWSTRTIVEDGHQYWRSYFHFNGKYAVRPLYVAFGQDAVLSDGYVKTLKAQFVQLRRWAYGCSDVAYVARNLLRKDRKVKIIPGWSRFFRLLEGHVSQSYTALIIAIGGWIPLFLNSESSRDFSAHQLPIMIGQIQQIAIIGILITIFLSFKILPTRPERYKKSRNILMVLQWVIMPITAVCYASASAFYSQTRLLLGRYMEKFDVTEKHQKK
ncbi:glycosyltransferase family 2 protein [Candidatus Saccharibacteria bacterium]|nr:glycosyltransferase family 2 protein [Candidatus Saccharibacteria bacterium]